MVRKKSIAFNVPLLNTSQKISLATAIYRLLTLVRKVFRKSDAVFVTRRGINWDLDLSEGIDFSIYLLGGFELSTQKLYQSLVKNEFIVFDIGANMGSHTLPLAKLVGDKGRVYAFEPTQYAFEKNKRNVDLNSELSARIYLRRIMLVGDLQSSETPDLYSSWPLDQKDGLHAQHRGRLMSTTGALVTTLDNFVEFEGIKRLDLVKLDVDGNEIEVLTGSIKTLRQFSPHILMEFAPYLFEQRMDALTSILTIVFELGYVVKEAATRLPLPRELHQLCQLVPNGGSMNILLEPIASSLQI